MKRIYLLLITIVSTGLIYSQNSLTVCDSLDHNINNITIDPNGVWEIGEPNKTEFDSSYTLNTNSIVTDLMQPYPAGDTSVFYFSYFVPYWGDGGIPNYLGIFSPFVLEFDHRFITDSITDYGSIDFSLDAGTTWYDLLGDSLNLSWESTNQNYHYFVGANDTLYDSLAVSGNSNGWVHSNFSKNVEQIIWNDGVDNDSILVRFTFITDNIGTGNNGWQIDNICMSMDLIGGTNEKHISNKIVLYPNPNNGSFKISDISNATLKIYNLMGQEIYSKYINDDTNHTIEENLKPGIYIIKIDQSGIIRTTKLIVE